MKRTFSFRKSDVPIVVVPGLFGSMSDVIVPGTGNWHFGLAGVVYKPFIKMLENMGYKQGIDLFVAYYDWRQPIETIANDYLTPIIQEAKRKTGQSKVNLLSHSMGGLVSRAYAQSNAYKNDVDQLIQMCTPNAGSPPNFSYWTGGMMPNQHNTSFNLVHLYMKVYLWLLEEMHSNNPIQAIHTDFPSLGDIVPARDYGDYLMVNSHTDTMQLKSYKRMKTHNKFLDYLNERSYTLRERGIEVTTIAGIGEPTVELLEVTPHTQGEKWVDGKVTGSVITNTGDGNATLKSVLSLKGDHYILYGSHNEVLLRSESILRAKLGKKKIVHGSQANSDNKDFILVCWKGKGRMKFVHTTESSHQLLEEHISDQYGYSLLLGKPQSDIQVIYESNYNEEMECVLSRNGVEDCTVQRPVQKGEKVKIL